VANVVILNAVPYCQDMRDPLSRISVKYKLTLVFVTVCILAFGVGGILVSRSAKRFLEDEIERRLVFQAQAYAAALDARLRMLARRTEDFASDGHIRSLLVRLQQSPAGGQARSKLRAELARHLRVNKLPLEQSFGDLTVVGAQGRILVGPRGEGAAAARPLARQAWEQKATSFSNLLAPRQGFPRGVLAISTALRSLGGRHIVGALVSWIRPEKWVAKALAEAELPEVGEGVALTLRDGKGQVLDVAGLLAPEQTLRGPSGRTRGGTGRGFSRSFPMTTSGWTVRVRQQSRAALEAIAGLQSRFLGVGLALSLIAGGLLYFPMRFLVGPLNRMKMAVERFKEGDYATRVKVTSEDEIGELARGLNQMADAAVERTTRLQRIALDLRQHQKQLKREHARLRGVISSMHDGLVVISESGEPVLANASAQPLLDFVRNGGEAATGHNGCERQDRRGECLYCLLDPKGPPRTCVLNLGQRVLEVHSTLLPPDGQGGVGRVLVSRDITERLAEDERQIHRERLAVLGEVGAVMAHELNNPLAAITMFAQMLEEDIAKDSPLRENVEVILRNVDGCKHAIRSLLDYAGNASPETRPVDVHEVIRDVLRFLRPVKEQSEVDLEFCPQAQRSVVSGDEVQLRQIFVNLLVNALQAVGAQGSIEVVTRDAADFLEVDVADSGPGVPKPDREQIFKPFYTTKLRGQGTGLGLPTARRIAESFGGGLLLLNGSQPGATFRVRLRSLDGSSS